MVNRFNVTVPTPKGKPERRTAYIYLPDSYDKDQEKRYPVLYMFDGHNVFFDTDATYGKCWGMKEYMDRTGTDMIIAAVECNHDPDNGRLKEYAPFSFSEPGFGKIPGFGRRTMDWYSGTFKTFIDRHYRTLPDRENTFICGSSMGGLMTLYAVLAYNSVYSRGAALSPSLWTSNKLVQMINDADIAPDTVLYMDYGSEEFINHKGMAKQFEKISGLLFKKGVFLNSRIVPGGTHCEASWERQIPFFMQSLTYEF